jgi:hypothetical protein
MQARKHSVPLSHRSMIVGFRSGVTKRSHGCFPESVGKDDSIVDH